MGKKISHLQIIDIRKISLLLVSIFIVATVFPILSVDAASVDFDDKQELGPGEGFTPDPKITSSGDNVYIVWKDGVKVITESETN